MSLINHLIQNFDIVLDPVLDTICNLLTISGTNTGYSKSCRIYWCPKTMELNLL